MSSENRVLVVHDGARHNYALPYAFASHGMLEAFYTDLCFGRGVGRISAMAASLPLPRSLTNVLDKLNSRKPPQEVIRRTRTADLTSIMHEMRVRQGLSQFEKQSARIESFHQRGALYSKWGLGDATHLFNVLGDGGELVLDAKSRGIPVLSDIIIALSTNDIVRDEMTKFPDWVSECDTMVAPNIRGFDPTQHVLETTDTFVCPSSFVARDLTQNWGVPSDRIRVVPYALKSNWFDIENTPEQGRVLFAGSAVLRKGIHYFAEATLILDARGQDYSYRVAGGVETVVRERKEARLLNFLGRIPRQEMISEYRKADVFVLPTLAEGSATVVYEAMAAGVPVITTKSSGASIENGVDGIIISERDPEALADSIEKLVEDREFRESVSKKAKERALSFGWASYTNSIVGLCV